MHPLSHTHTHIHKHIILSVYVSLLPTDRLINSALSVKQLFAQPGFSICPITLRKKWAIWWLLVDSRFNLSSFIRMNYNLCSTSCSKEILMATDRASESVKKRKKENASTWQDQAPLPSLLTQSTIRINMVLHLYYHMRKCLDDDSEFIGRQRVKTFQEWGRAQRKETIALEN